MNVSAIQTIAQTRNEQIGGDHSSCPMALTFGDVVCEHRAGRGMQWHQASLAEFAAADREHRRFQIDILDFEVARFAEA